MDRQDRIGNKAKDALVKEVVAFANSYGGTLLLGIRESESKPPVAASFSPVPQCAELAERLTSVFLSRLEPLLTRLEIKPVKIVGEDGVVVINVGQSRLAPHRDSRNRICYKRRSDRSEPMTMREIQEMTLNVSRGLERLDKKFAERSQIFQKEFNYLTNPDDVIGFRLTAIPVGDDIWFDRVYRPRKLLSHLDEPWRKVYNHGERDGPRELVTSTGISSFHWRPKLRAARGDSDSFFANSGFRNSEVRPRFNVYREVHCEGLIELGLVSHSMHTSPYEKYISSDLPPILFANLISHVHRVRTQAGAPMAEYAVEVTIMVKGTPKFIGRPGPQYGEPLGSIVPGPLEFPRYALADVNDFLATLNLFHRDLFNALSQDIDTDQYPLSMENWLNSAQIEDGEDED